MYTLLTAKSLYDATRRPLQPQTPRRVYRFFLICFQLSYGAAAVGYVLLVLEFFGGLSVLPIGEKITSLSLRLIFYGSFQGSFSPFYSLLVRFRAVLRVDRQRFGRAVQR
jgi:hypothetical protein